MEWFYVTDLDGTLLQPNAQLSAQAKRTIPRLLEAEIPLTIATARSITSVKEIFEGIPLKLPIVCSNGAYYYDLVAGRHLATQGLESNHSHEVVDLVKKMQMHCFVVTFNGTRDHLYLEAAMNEGVAWYRQERERVGDPRIREISDLRRVRHEQVMSINIIDRGQAIRSIQTELENRYAGKLALYMYEDFFLEDWYWLSVYHPLANKGRAIETLLNKVEVQRDRLTVFGDQLNDISMFEMAPRGLAVKNARPELKALATQVIGPNTEDAVLRFICEETGVRMG